MAVFHKKETLTGIDLDVENRIKKYPRAMRKKLRELYKDYKEGKLIFPEGYDKKKFLNKE